MSNEEIIKTLFPDNNTSIGQLEEYEETIEMLKTESGRKALIDYINGRD